MTDPKMRDPAKFTRDDLLAYVARLQRELRELRSAEQTERVRANGAERRLREAGL